MAPLSALQELEPIAEALNAESDEANTIIAALNAKLAALNIGVEVWLGPWEGDGNQIGFGKILSNSSWELATRLCEKIRPVLVDGEETGEWEPVPGEIFAPKPLLSAPRSVRIHALRLLPKIVRELKAEAQRSIDAIRAAKKMASEL